MVLFLGRHNYLLSKKSLVIDIVMIIDKELNESDKNGDFSKVLRLEIERQAGGRVTCSTRKDGKESSIFFSSMKKDARVMMIDTNELVLTEKE